MEIFKNEFGQPLCKMVGGHKKPIFKQYPSHNDSYLGITAISISDPMIWYSQADLSAKGITVNSFGGYYAEDTNIQGYGLLTVDPTVFPFVWHFSYYALYWGSPPGVILGGSDRDPGEYSVNGCITGIGQYNGATLYLA